MSLNIMPTIRKDLCGQPYAYLDPASGRKRAKNANARTAIVVMRFVPPAYYFSLFVWAARASTTEITEQVFSINSLFRPRAFGVEVAGQQYLLYSHLEDEARRRGIFLPLVEGKEYTDGAKDDRIRDTIQPLVIQGRFVVQTFQRDLRDELTTFPTGATKDIIDAASSCINMMPKPTPLRAKLDNRQAILDYLYQSGATQEVIAKYTVD